VLIGAWLTRSWQRKQWILEGKKAEYRELLSTLSESYHTIRSHVPAAKPVVISAERDRASAEAWLAGIKQVRLFMVSVTKHFTRLQNFLGWQATINKTTPQHQEGTDQPSSGKLEGLCSETLGNQRSPAESSLTNCCIWL
jgi:hypothetical protein